MSQVINTNIMSLTAQNNLNKSQSSLATAMQRLSSGLRINSSADDAAGFAISTRMTTQIDGLNTAAQNANDGISLAQTASAALTQITTNLQTIRQLAVQAANATNSDTDRAALDSEVQQRLDEITRVSQQTTFNGRRILDGSFGTAAFQVGANVGETISINLSQGTGASQIGGVSSASHDVSAEFSAGLSLGTGDLTVTVGAVSASVASGSYTSASALASAINTAATAAGYAGAGTFASVSGSEIKFSDTSTSAVTFGGAKAAGLGLTNVAAQTAGAAAVPGSGESTGLTTLAKNAFNVSGTAFTIGGQAITGDFKSVSGIEAAINAVSGTTKVSATVDGTNHLVLASSSGSAVAVAGAAATSLGVNGNVSSGTAVTGSVAYSSALNNEYELSDLTIGGGSAITGKFTDAASFVTALAGHLPTGLTAAVDGTEVKFSNTGSAAVAFGGTDATALGLPSSVAAETPAGADVPGAATSSGVNAAVTAALSAQTFASGAFTVNGTSITGSFSGAQGLADAINAKGIQGVSAYLDVNKHLEIQSNGAAVTLGGSGAVFARLGFTAGAVAASGSLQDTNVKTVAGANDTINRIDSALASVSSIDSQLGAMQNRFDSAVATAQAVSQNLAGSRSRIEDADFASETASMSQAQILQQAGISMLAQANAAPQLVLKLLQ